MGNLMVYVVSGTVAGGGQSILATPIRMATHTPLPAIAVGHQPFDLSVTSDGHTLFVVDTGSDTDTPIHIATRHVRPAIPVPHQPFTLAVAPNGKTLYVTGGSNLLLHIDVTTHHPGTSIAVGDSPSAMAFALVV